VRSGQVAVTSAAGKDSPLLTTMHELDGDESSIQTGINNELPIELITPTSLSRTLPVLQILMR
jgi:hypothetical protein